MVRIALGEVWGALRVIYVLAALAFIEMFSRVLGSLRLLHPGRKARRLGHGLDHEAGRCQPGPAPSRKASEVLAILKNVILIVLKVVVSLGLMVYLLSRVDLALAAAAIRSANYAYLVLALLSMLERWLAAA